MKKLLSLFGLAVLFAMPLFANGPDPVPPKGPTSPGGCGGPCGGGGGGGFVVKAYVPGVGVVSVPEAFRPVFR